MRRNLVKGGAVTALVGGTASLVGAILIAIQDWLNWNVPSWVQGVIPIFTIGLAIFTIGASLALLGLATK